MNKYYKKFNSINWYNVLIENEIINLYNSEFKLKDDYESKLKFELKAYHHCPDWKDYGQVKNKLLDEYISSILQQLNCTEWINSISILCSKGNIPKHTELYNKTSALIVPIISIDDVACTNFFKNGNIVEKVVIDAPTLIKTDIPHSVCAKSGSLRIVLSMRSVAPLDFISIMNILEKSGRGFLN